MLGNVISRRVLSSAYFITSTRKERFFRGGSDSPPELNPRFLVSWVVLSLSLWGTGTGDVNTSAKVEFK